MRNKQRLKLIATETFRRAVDPHVYVRLYLKGFPLLGGSKNRKTLPLRNIIAHCWLPGFTLGPDCKATGNLRVYCKNGDPKDCRADNLVLLTEQEAGEKGLAGRRGRRKRAEGSAVAMSADQGLGSSLEAAEPTAAAEHIPATSAAAVTGAAAAFVGDAVPAPAAAGLSAAAGVASSTAVLPILNFDANSPYTSSSPAAGTTTMAAGDGSGEDDAEWFSAGLYMPMRIEETWQRGSSRGRRQHLSAKPLPLTDALAVAEHHLSTRRVDLNVLAKDVSEETCAFCNCGALTGSLASSSKEVLTCARFEAIVHSQCCIELRVQEPNLSCFLLCAANDC